MARTASYRLRHRLAAVVALLALAATYFTPLVNPDWNAWRFDHGHASIDGVVAQHSHPWDSSGTPSRAKTDADGSAFAFTASGDSVPGFPAILHAVALEAAPTLLAILVGADPAPPADDPAPAVIPPPPRFELSLT